MIRSLPYCTDSIYSIAKEGEWYYDFMNACLMHGSTAILPRFINPEFEHELGNNIPFATIRLSIMIAYI